MLAYNLLWLECIQKGKKETFIEVSEYYNTRENCSLIGKPGISKIFNFGDTVIISPDNANFPFPVSGVLDIVGESITLESDLEFNLGLEVNIIPSTKISYCEIEEFFEN